MSIGFKCSYNAIIARLILQATYAWARVETLKFDIVYKVC